MLLLFFLTSTSRAEWKPQEQLVQPGPVNTKDFYGASVRMSGDYVVVGAHGERSKGRFAGAAYVYKFNPVTASYDHEATLWAADADEKDRFGISVAIYETTVVVGA